MLPALNVYTDLDPQALNVVGMWVYARWVAFALGQSEIGGKVLMHPTGRYASSISYRKYGKSHVAIIADENFAPEGAILEKGHAAIDLKQYMRRGQVVPMHRGAEGHYGSRGYGSPAFAATPKSRRLGKQRNIWGQVRAEGFSGYATVTGSGWIIPPMAAYAPAQHLKDMIQEEFGRGRA